MWLGGCRNRRVIGITLDNHYYCFADVLVQWEPLSEVELTKYNRLTCQFLNLEVLLPRERKIGCYSIYTEYDMLNEFMDGLLASNNTLYVEWQCWADQRSGLLRSWRHTCLWLPPFKITHGYGGYFQNSFGPCLPCAYRITAANRLLEQIEAPNNQQTAAAMAIEA